MPSADARFWLKLLVDFIQTIIVEEARKAKVVPTLTQIPTVEGQLKITAKAHELGNVTHKINRPFFFESVKKSLFGRFNQRQVNGLNYLLDIWEAGYSDYDDRFLAYALGTAFHEVDRTMMPIEEYGQGKGKKYGIPDPVTGKTYFGRGYVQCTWKTNYLRAGKELVPSNPEIFVKDPTLMLLPQWAAPAMYEGMIEGWYTGKKLSDYFNAKTTDWVNARRIINSLDKASTIAAYARNFYAAISYMK